MYAKYSILNIYAKYSILKMFICYGNPKAVFAKVHVLNVPNLRKIEKKPKQNKKYSLAKNEIFPLI